VKRTTKHAFLDLAALALALTACKGEIAMAFCPAAMSTTAPPRIGTAWTPLLPAK
jgi:hypothetical protein